LQEIDIELNSPKFKIIYSFLTFISGYENIFDIQITFLISHKINSVVKIEF